MVKDAGKKIYNCLKEGKTEEELKQKLKKEAHKKNALQMELKEIHEGIKPLEKLRSLQGGAGCGEIPYHIKKLWRVLEVAFAFPLLGESFARGFPPLKAVLIQGKWQWRASRLVPFGAGGTVL